MNRVEACLCFRKAKEEPEFSTPERKMQICQEYMLVVY